MMNILVFEKDKKWKITCKKSFQTRNKMDEGIIKDIRKTFRLKKKQKKKKKKMKQSKTEQVGMLGTSLSRKKIL